MLHDTGIRAAAAHFMRELAKFGYGAAAIAILMVQEEADPCLRQVGLTA